VVGWEAKKKKNLTKAVTEREGPEQKGEKTADRQKKKKKKTTEK